MKNTIYIILAVSMMILIGCDKKKIPSEFAVDSLPATSNQSQKVVKDTPDAKKPTEEEKKKPADDTKPAEMLGENEIIKNAFAKYADANIDAKFNMDAMLNEADNPKLLTQYFTILENKDENFWDKKKNEKAYLATQRFKDVFDLYGTSETFQTELKKRVPDQILNELSEDEKNFAYPILYNLHLGNTIYGSDMDQFHVYTSKKRDDNKTLRTMVLGRVDFSGGKKALDAKDKTNLGVAVNIWGTWLDSKAKKPDGLSKKIQGHADFDKPQNAKANVKAGDKRANIVYEAANSVLKDVFDPESMGDLLPLLKDDPKSPKNRRAEIVITQKEYSVQNMGKLQPHNH